MFIGHFAPAFVAATYPNAPRLGTLFLAAQLVDFAFFAFVLMGVENMRITPGITAMNPMDLFDMPYTHSLLGSVILGAFMAGIIWVVTRRAAAALIAGSVVVSHWFLDLLVHTRDLTLTGSPPKLGLGLWNTPLVEMPLELGMTGAALGYYLSKSRPASGATATPIYTLSAALLLLQLYNWLAPEPQAVDASLPVSALLAFALLAWLAYRLDRTRSMKQAL